MMLYTNPISSTPAVKVPFIWNIRAAYGVQGSISPSSVHLCWQFRVLSAFPALYDPGQMHSQRPCPQKLTEENPARSEVRCCYIKLWLSVWPQGKHSQDESKRVWGLLGVFCLFYVLTILTTLPFASLNRNESSSNNNCHKCELMALWTIENVRKYLDFVTVSIA